MTQRPHLETDPLTGLALRPFLFARGPELLGQAERADQVVLLLVLDLDGFKQINDWAGHDVGDRVIGLVGARLRATCHPGDLAVRLGGDEFAVLTRPMSEASAAETSQRLAESLIEAIQRPMELDDLRVSVGVSVGVAAFDVDGDTVNDLLRAADQAMYAAKAIGSGRWRASTPPDRLGRALHRRLRNDLRDGRLLGGLAVDYQPQVATGGDVVGFEALARWDHPELGRLLPAQFIPLAERSGAMAQLTTAVLEQALDDVAELDAAAPGCRLSVNVSRRHILGRGLVPGLGRLLERHGCDPARLVLEVTEPAIRTSATVAGVFEELDRRGFQVSIRGFGTPRSSLAALWSNPAAREVKLDPAVVAGSHDRDVARLVAALTGAAHDLDIRVVAEGVQDGETADRLGTLGCDALQGFWVHPPAPLADVVGWARAR